ncbi:protein of unknown function [Methylocella tundrae]|uniref:Uncharacterized protein n=1 Tax=Methylocella tundrae TaxID=227605 RepID=A0A4U8Z0R6_METTU|nr:protein of unknown function [Methylocella tundrae]
MPEEPNGVRQARSSAREWRGQPGKALSEYAPFTLIIPASPARQSRLN